VAGNRIQKGCVMASSGLDSFAVNELDVVTDAMDTIGALAEGEVPNGSQVVLGRRKLNMIVKQWSHADFAPGLKTWTRKRAYLFLTNSAVYDLGPNGHFSESYVQTTLTSSAGSGASTVSISSATGMSASDHIGIQTATGMFWTTISGTPTTTVTLASALTANVDSGAAVYVYTTAARRPASVLTVMLRNADGRDLALDPLSHEQYEYIADKSLTGQPNAYFYEAQRTNGKLYLNRVPDVLTNVLRISYYGAVDDSTHTTDTLDFPPQWARALTYQLAIDLCEPFGRPVTPNLQNLAAQSFAIAGHFDAETSLAVFAPNEAGMA
jgi:hypothetical protein